MIQRFYKPTQVLNRKLWIWQSYKREISTDENEVLSCNEFLSLPDTFLKNDYFSRECLDPIKELYDVCQYPEDPQTDFLYASLVFLTFINRDEVVDYYFSIYPKLRSLEEDTDYVKLFNLILDAYSLGVVSEECIARETISTKKVDREGKKRRAWPSRGVAVDYCYKAPRVLTEEYSLINFYSFKDLLLRDTLDEFDCLKNPTNALLEASKPDRYVEEEYLLEDFLYAVLVVLSFQEDYLLDYFLDLFPWVKDYSLKDLYELFVGFYEQEYDTLDKKYWPRELNIEMTT